MLHRQATGGEGDFTWPMTPRDANWLAVEVRSADGVLLAIANPLFFGQSNASAQCEMAALNS